MNEEIKKYLFPGKNNLFIIYLLCLSSMIVDLLWFVAFIMVYVNLDIAKERSHYIYIFRSLWIGLAWYIFSWLCTLILIGPFMMAGVNIWFVIRMIYGLKLLTHGKPHPHPRTLLVT